MPTSGADSARRPSRYESQKRRDWQTFTRYLSAHRPPLQLRRCSGAHVLEFLRHLDRSGKTRVHAQPCPAYGGGGAGSAACRCPLRQAWGSLDALVGRLRAAYDERHGRRTTTDGGGAGNGDGSSANPFAARAVRLYLRDVRDAQARARGISYHRNKKKKQQSKQGGRSSSSRAVVGASASLSKHDAMAVQHSVRGAHGNVDAAIVDTEAAPEPPHHPYPAPPQAYLHGVPLECWDHGGGVSGGAYGASGPAGFCGSYYLPLLFNTFG